MTVFLAFIMLYRAGDLTLILNSLRFIETYAPALIAPVKAAVEKGLHLYAPNNKYPLVLETDGSDDGWGAVLFQRINGKKHIIKMWSKQWATEAWWKKPPYHREAKAWMNGMTLTMPYTMCNPFLSVLSVL